MNALAICFLVILGIILLIPILYGIIHKVEIRILNTSDMFALANFCIKTFFLFAIIVLTEGLIHQTDWEPYANYNNLEHKTIEPAPKRKITAVSTIEHILVTWSK